VKRVSVATALVVVAAATLGWSAAGANPQPSNGLSHDGLAAGWTLLATPKRGIFGYSSPGGRKFRAISAKWHGEPLTMPVIALRDGFYEVRLPGRPNGSTAWVNETQVTNGVTPYNIVINLRSTHLRLQYKGKTVLYAPVGVGTAHDPTPSGHFFVAFYAEPPNPGYGPFVMVTSAHSNTITDWEDSGDAMVAIHGPLGAGRTIGRNGARVSHGCVRMHLKDQVKLRDVPVGTPVAVIT
jgi:hypothetical protein